MAKLKLWFHDENGDFDLAAACQATGKMPLFCEDDEEAFRALHGDFVDPKEEAMEMFVKENESYVDGVLGKTPSSIAPRPVVASDDIVVPAEEALRIVIATQDDILSKIVRDNNGAFGPVPVAERPFLHKLHQEMSPLSKIESKKELVETVEEHCINIVVDILKEGGFDPEWTTEQCEKNATLNERVARPLAEAENGKWDDVHENHTKKRQQSRFE